MPDKSTPSPSDPNSSKEKSPSLPESEKKLPEKEKPRLKLKRLVVKDLKINPHINPDAEPVPHAEPISEPEPEPVPDDVKANLSMASQNLEPHLEELVSPEHPVDNPAPAPVESTPDPEAEIKKETEPEQESAVEAGSEESPVPRKKSRRTFIFPVLLIAASLLYGIHVLFDPLGLAPDPIVPAEVPIQAVVKEEPIEQIPENPLSSLEITTNINEGGKLNIQEYLKLVPQQELQVSESPEGIYINSVFYEEGMSLNPSLGLTIKSLSENNGHHVLTIIDNNGQTYPVDIPKVGSK